MHSVMLVTNGEYLSVESTPGIWVYPRATRRTLNWPSILFLKTQLYSIRHLLGEIFILLGFWHTHLYIMSSNTRKTVIMVWYPFHTPGRMLVVVYGSRAAGMGPTYREWKRMYLQCLECGVDVVEGFLLTHHQSNHGMGRRKQRGAPPPSSLPGNPRHIRSLSWEWCCNSGANQRGAWVGHQTGPTLGFTLRTSMWRTMFWSRSSVTNPTLGEPSAACLCCKDNSTSGTSQQTFASEERSGIFAKWWKRRRGRRQQLRSAPMGPPSPQYPPSSALSEQCWRRTPIGRW